MIKILFKQNKDGSLSLLLVKDGSEFAIVFDSMGFAVVKNDEVDTNEYKLLDTKENLVSLDEIRNEEFDVFYFKMNNQLIFQISWIPNGNNMLQQLGIYDKSMTSKILALNKTVYESAVSRFLDADEYEDLLYPFWK